MANQYKDAEWEPIKVKRDPYVVEIYRSILPEDELMQGDCRAEELLRDVWEAAQSISQIAFEGRACRDENSFEFVPDVIFVALIMSCSVLCSVAFGPHWVERCEPFLSTRAWRWAPYYRTLSADREAFFQREGETIAASVKMALKRFPVNQQVFLSSVMTSAAWVQCTLYPTAGAEDDKVGNAVIERANALATEFAKKVEQWL